MSKPSIAVNKWVVMLVGALLAMMAIFVLSNPVHNAIFAHPHDPAQDDHIHYAEDSMDEVRDFDSTDPEGARIEWNVRGLDAADFEISSTGVLTFRESPDFENATDRARAVGDLNGDGDEDDPGEAAEDAGNNDYLITVSATEMRAGANAPLPAKRTDIALTVTVENADDPGELTLQWLQPEVGTAIGTTLTDPDGEVTNPTRIWYTSKAADPVVGNMFHWNVITGETDNSYDPVAADEGKYLWVNVKYTDPEDPDDATKTADAKSENPVRAAVSDLANASPDFQVPTDTRTVPESTAVDDPVGLPVVATDSDNDILTYELIEVASPNNGDDEFFDIDQESGQITVAQNLDYDAIEGRTDGATAGTYMVIVRATDPSGLADSITITITAENVNEHPIVTGRAELSVAEGTDDGYTTLPDAPGGLAPPNPTNQLNEYVYEDPDERDSIARWDLEGDDAGAFDDSGRFEPRYLQFKEAPDFENPTDANNDNVYEVTLVATDTDPLSTGAGIGKVNVWVTVTNVEEEGKVVFTEGETAYLNETLVAEVQDPDDKGGDLGEPYQGVHIVTWQWSRSLDDDDPGNAPFVDIDGATTNGYTPVDDDRGYYLRATATYTDPHSADDNPDTPDDDRLAAGSLKTEMATTENVVRLAPGPASVPTFDETGTVTREVAENTAPGGNVGVPVEAMGPATLVYSLDGSDAKYFNIDDMGQITVGGDVEGTVDVEEGANPELDYEDPMKRRFSVTVKVKVMDGLASQNDQVDVNIIVTDVDEPPVITDEDVDEPPMTAVNYPEIKDGAPNAAAIATYVGTDPEGDTISWDLRGADAALFTISAGGVLQFVNSPDFEDMKDVVGTNTATPDATANDNIYDVVIRAIASRVSGDTGPAETVDTTVAVTVTDVNEDGEVVISLLQPEAATLIMASLTDPDGGVSGTTWEWEVSEVAANVLEINEDNHWGDAPGTGANSDQYIPADSDAAGSKYLRVTASYTDTNGSDETARAMSVNPVQAEGLGENNQSPDFDGDKVERSVAETAEVGANVPGPVVATVVAPSATDILTYGLRAVTDTDLAGITGVTLPSEAGTGPDDDLAAFNIDKATGQITVAQELDFESRGTPDDDGKYVVVATVTDPSNLGDSIVVVITAEDRNEDPVLSGRPELTINEIDGGDEDAANPDFVGDAADNVNVYNVVDEDDRAATDEWRLEGEDKDQFQLIGEIGRTLVFKELNQPDYENPADADGDNVYKVTVVTFDGDGGRGEFHVCIAVLNINEIGKVTLFDEDGVELVQPVQPYADRPITAKLTDPDGGITGLAWVWTSSPTSPNASWPDAPIGMEATYTPDNEDTSEFLRATASYKDIHDDGTADTDRTAMATTDFSVLEAKDEKRPPKFLEETAMRMVAENAPSTTFVGDPVSMAMDPDDPEGERLTYTLEDSDNDSKDTAFFELLSTNDGEDNTAYTDDDVYSTQIRVKLHDMAHDLDHEAEGRNGIYEVVLKVSDGSPDTDDDTITVTITVTDRNEAPLTPAESTGEAPVTPTNNAPEFPATEDGARSVAENTAAGENIGDPVEATDADAGDTLTYTLGGADMASFDIDGATGQLMTKDALDFEAPADVDTDNAYEVTVMADDGNGGTASIDVTITVTEVVGLDNAYDTDNSGVIEGSEVIQAVKDYFADDITGPEVIAVVKLYFAGRSN